MPNTSYNYMFLNIFFISDGAGPRRAQPVPAPMSEGYP